jgi:hypothetical protein
MLNTQNNQEKDWWAPVWRGLVVDSDSKHVKAIGQAVWLYIYLIIHANRQTGVVLRCYQTIVKDMGIPERSISRWFSILKEHGYIQASFNGKSFVIHIQKWKRVGKKPQPAAAVAISGQQTATTGKL